VVQRKRSSASRQTCSAFRTSSKCFRSMECVSRLGIVSLFGMNLLLHAIFKFCTTKRLFKYLNKCWPHFKILIATASSRSFDWNKFCQEVYRLIPGPNAIVTVWGGKIILGGEIFVFAIYLIQNYLGTTKFGRVLSPNAPYSYGPSWPPSFWVLVETCVPCTYRQFFLRHFRDPIRVPRIENRVPRIREIGSLQVP